MSEETKFVKSVDTYQVNLALEIFKSRGNCSALVDSPIFQSSVKVLENALTLKDGERPDNSQINLARDIYTVAYYISSSYENLQKKVEAILVMALEN
jgi:hypothetical protein